MKISKKFKSLVLVGVLLASLPISALAKGPEKKVIDYVALGDSLAFGITPDPANPLGLGYPDYLNQRFEQSQYTVDYDNFSVPKYTSVLLLNDVLTNTTVRDEIKEAEFITIDIGANDVLPVLAAYLNGVATPNDIQAAIVGVRVNLGFILQEIDNLNPNAKVYVMGYYNPFPHKYLELQPLLLQLLGTLNGFIEDVSIINGDTFLPTDRIIAKDIDTYLPNPDNIHLSLEGYQLVAKEFWKVIDKSKSN